MFGLQPSSEDIQLTSKVLQLHLPGHGLCGEELQLVVVQTEAGEGEEAGQGLALQVVQGVVAETEPFHVLQALQEEEASGSTRASTAGGRSQAAAPERPRAPAAHLEGQVGDVDKLIVCE